MWLKHSKVLKALMKIRGVSLSYDDKRILVSSTGNLIRILECANYKRSYLILYYTSRKEKYKLIQRVKHLLDENNIHYRRDSFNTFEILR